MTTKLKTLLMFWNWPSLLIIRHLQKELKQLRVEHDALKAKHQKLTLGQKKLLEWVRTTHRLDRFPGRHSGHSSER